MKTIELAVEGDHEPLRLGQAYTLSPVVEGGAIVAYHVADDDGATVMTIPVSAARVAEDHDEKAEVDRGTSDAEAFLTPEEEIELLRALGYDV
jgi:hypothetical protein